MNLRHCERSAAIQGIEGDAARPLDCFVAIARRKTASFDAFGQNPISLTGFDVKRSLQNAIVDVAIG
jgi:hypothetical protein